MLGSIWPKIKNKIATWPGGELPGIAVIGLVMLARLNGYLQFSEWITLDTFLRLRPSEPMDERVVIVGIDEEDIQDVGTYPIPDQDIARLLRRLQTYKPRAIGLDIVRDLPVEPGHEQLVETFEEIKTLIAIEKVLPTKIKPPPGFPPERVGFSDVLFDGDGNVRRSLLGTPTPEGGKFSLSLSLAKTYLTVEGISLENGIKNPDGMMFGSTELPRFLPNSGGYVGTDAGGVQVLLNFRSGRERFRILSLKDIKTENFNPSWIRDRIVIVGVTTPSIKDTVNTTAIKGLNPPGKIYGVEFHAHATSQILSAVLDQRSLLRTWSDPWEYLWILGWGFLAIGLGRLTQSPFKNLFGVGVASFGLVGVGYVFLVWGWWIPVAPALLILVINSLLFPAFYHYDQALRSQINVRQRTIDETFNIIHNGPMQTLAYTITRIQNQDLPEDELLLKLKTIKDDIWEIADYLKQETLTQEETIRLGSNLKLSLKHPISKLFYEVCRDTLERHLPHFNTLKVKALKFEEIPEQYLTIEQNRELCQFLEEALYNVGKHAKGVTRISAIGKLHENRYTLSVKDNGSGMCSSSENRGTQQAKALAKQLGGTFKREPISPHGTLCELTWPLAGRNWSLAKVSYGLKTLFLKVFKYPKKF
ncbi:MAG: CHASE2 domain-containing protein [Moorea sp. SIO1G6]|uniref:sensor histidine kinase n=1 Tax=Moorena sp. SIO1G6 TaxID=2607840 RepID=UPI0013BF05F2|nr:CHASE2 domain-containing protein [Moorena sp. SIO1G6]NET67112.1 CHASE2 domain-containing protein [Moorena sp. SIO1G6]